MTKNRKNEPLDLPEGFRTFHEEHGVADELDGYEKVLNEAPKTCARLNPRKFPGKLPGEGVPWCDTAHFLSERPIFKQDPLFHGGAYYVQEASSTVIGSLAKALLSEKKENGPLRILDLCAAPGGKSTQLASILPQDGLLLSNEAIGKRVPLLLEQLRKWGEPNVLITKADPEQFGKNLPESFDLIVVDAPCSGEGLFRKMPEHRKDWGPGMVEHCARRQQRILNDVWPALRTGGHLIHCTCTLNRKENEEPLLPFLKDGRASSQKAPDIRLREWKKEEWKGAISYRSWPQHTRGEGFCFSILRKEKGEDAPSPLDVPLSRKQARKKPEAPKELKELFEEAERWRLIEEDESYFVLEERIVNAVHQLEARIPVAWKGTWVATIKGQDRIPAPDLALSPILSENAYPMVDLDGANALRFLARDKLSPELFPKGFCGVRYEGVPLGWIKNLGERVNGHFPKQWRLTGYTGEDPVDLRA